MHLGDKYKDSSVLGLSKIFKYYRCECIYGIDF
jgi:hypothetical protein